jgi:RNA polymerase sigma-70 factor (ECF subfamily)
MSITTAVQEVFDKAHMSVDAEPPEQLWKLIERYRGELINQAFAILGNLSDAEDVVQESFCEVLKNTARLNEERSVGLWLRTINRGNALNRARGKRRDSHKLIQKQQKAPGRNVTTGGFSGMEMCESVAKAIEMLPPDQRAVVVARYWEHLSYDQIAGKLSLSPRKVRRLFHDASLHLHRTLSQFLANPEEGGPR